MNLAIDHPELIIGVENLPSFRPLTDGISAYELWQVQKLKRDLRQEYLDHWNATVELTGTGRPVDVILSPCAPYVAPPHGMNKCVFSLLLNGAVVDELHFHYYVGTRITRRYGMAWTILHSSCQLGYRLILSSTRRNLPTNFIMSWTRQTTTFVRKLHPHYPPIRTHPFYVYR